MRGREEHAQGERPLSGAAEPALLRHVRLDTGPFRALLTIARPETRNAVDPDLIDELSEALSRVEAWADQSPRAVVLIVAGGERAFASGANLNYLASIGSSEEMARFSTSMQAVLNRIEDLPLPVIAAMEGPALGGGTELVLACDVRILGARAYFSFKYARVGVVPGWGGAQRLARIVGRRQALLLLATASAVDPDEAARLGLADRLVMAGRALEEAESLAARMSELAPLSVRSFKTLLTAAASSSRSEAQQRETREFVRLWASNDHKEGLASILEKREPHFRGD